MDIMGTGLMIMPIALMPEMCCPYMDIMGTGVVIMPIALISEVS